MIDSIIKNSSKTVIEQSLSKIPLMSEYQKIHNTKKLKLDVYLIELIKIGALLHDIGHGPFSHLFDDLFLSETSLKHEDRSCFILEKIVSESSELSHFMKPIDIEIIKATIKPDHHDGFIFQIVANYNSYLDVDKCDYLKRDTFMLNLSYDVDIERIIRSAKVIHNQICYSKKVFGDIVNLFETRYKLHKYVYHHKMVISSQILMCDIMKCLDEHFHFTEWIQDYDKFIKLTDSFIMTSAENISLFANVSDEIQSKLKILVDRFHTRQLSSLILSLTRDKELTQETFTKIVESKKYKSSDLILVCDKIGLVGGNDSNPLDKIRFYNGDHICEMSKWENSLIIPQSYQEYLIMIYYKTKLAKKNVKIIKNYLEAHLKN
jgi:HD superfamily phosphohydrolase